MIRPATPDDLDRLREIAIASKGHWGFDREVVRMWGERLEPSGEVFVAESDGRVVAWAAVTGREAVCELDHLWVEPAAMSRGVGRELFEFAVALARRMGGRRLEWEAEPNAVGFYERVGARYLRDSAPSEWGRILPVMGLDL